MSLYVDPDDLKLTLGITSKDFDDDLERACFAASGAIDEYCDTVFALSDDSNDETRLFTPSGPTVCVIDELASFSELKVDRAGNGQFLEEWTAADFVFYPENATAKNKPYQWLKARPTSARSFPGYPQSVAVTGRFGWAETPIQIVEATGLVATQLWKRRREAPFGILGLDQQTAARVLRYDPDLCRLLDPFVRPDMVA